MASASASAKSVCTRWSELPPKVQQQIREKQLAAKARKQKLKSEKLAKKKVIKFESKAASSSTESYPSSITDEQYFDACPGGCFRHPSIISTEQCLDLVLTLNRNGSVIAECDDGTKLTLAHFNYFIFGGTDAQTWSPRFYAKLAFEGFFSITSKHRGPSVVLLPELQPFYSVVDWHHFNASKHVRKALKRIRKAGVNYYVRAAKSPDNVWSAMDQYHRSRQGENWLTRRYLDTALAASADPTLNFKLHAIELRSHDDASKLLAGEIGYSVGRVYTSLSGHTCARTDAGLGTVQLVLLGYWLQSRGYAFWSMGHCYSPAMDYKRRLGHRVLPRRAFLQRVHATRGKFLHPDGESRADFVPLQDNDSFSSSSLVAVSTPTSLA